MAQNPWSEIYTPMKHFLYGKCIPIINKNEMEKELIIIDDVLDEKE